ncbi:phosphoribosylformylglycinamidine synthase subunit PurS [candidate division CSSED10-310 bacterium]|uniref:Phosphoribosylformylglycinamidine synthase subunit PurS n=1 Tax=candidate division CSSED10-310 bacterium TaxID=2855610 RepID=A0ABV6Z281_UNCC1
MKVKIHVTLKKSVLDPQGEAVKKGLLTLGFAEIDQVRIGKYFEIDLKVMKGQNLREDISKMCEKLLANPVIEDYEIDIPQEGS